MPKNAATTQTGSGEMAGASPAPASKKKAPAARAPKHVKAQAVAAAVEGFVAAIVHPADTEARKAERAPEPAKTETAAAPEHRAAVQDTAAPAIADQGVAELSRPGLPAKGSTKPVTHADVAKLAYEFYLERKGQNGTMADDWFRAEQTLGSSAATYSVLPQNRQ